MKAQLRDVICPDIENLTTYIPSSPECFGFLLQLLIGPEGQEGEESFEVEVVTPSWLTRTFSRDDVIIGRHYLIVFEYEWDRILRKIKEQVESCSGKDWDEVAAKLCKLGAWEFEDY